MVQPSIVDTVSVFGPFFMIKRKCTMTRDVIKWIQKTNTNKRTKRALHFVASGNPPVVYLNELMFLLINLPSIVSRSAINTINIQMLNHRPGIHLNTNFFALDVRKKVNFSGVSHTEQKKSLSENADAYNQTWSGVCVHCWFSRNSKQRLLRF